MSYIGKAPGEHFTSFQTETFSVSATTSYTLSYAVANENELALFINNVRQQPGSGKAYTASGTALTLSAATASTDTMYAIYLGRALQTITPATNSITSGMLGSAFFTGATDVGGALADADLLLIDDGAGGTLRKTAASRIKTYVGSGLSEVHQWRLNTSFTGGSASPIASNWEVADSYGYGGIGSGMTQSSGVFTFPSTGIWLIQYNLAWKANGGDGDVRYAGGFIKTSTNAGSGDTYNETAGLYSSAEDPSDAYHESAGGIMTVFDVTNTTTHKVRFQFATHNSSIDCYGDTNSNLTTVVFMKLGDT